MTIPREQYHSWVMFNNASAMAHANSRIENLRTKYIDIACHFIREKIEEGNVEIIYVTTKHNLADIFTKPLQGPRFKMLLSKLNVSAKLSLESHYVRPDVDTDDRLTAGEFVGNFVWSLRGPSRWIQDASVKAICPNCLIHPVSLVLNVLVNSSMWIGSNESIVSMSAGHGYVLLNLFTL